MRKTWKILLLVDTGTEYGRGLLRGIAKYSLLHGPWTFYWGEPFYHQTKNDLFSDTMKTWKPDGIIVRYEKYLDKVLATKIPVVYATDCIKGIAKLSKSKTAVFSCDWAATGRMGAEHLFDCGFRYFAYCGYEGMHWSNERGKAFGETVSRLGRKVFFYKPLEGKGVRPWHKELPELAFWLSKLPKPIGLMACNDDRGKQIIEACKAADIRVPDEIAIIGVDNDELICTLCTPQLSSINLNPEETGYQISEMLDQLMVGKKLNNSLVLDKPTHVVTRQSTDVLAIEDSIVSEAVSFIRKNSKKMTTVSDVVDSLGFARRTLELRFRQALGRSVNTEINRCKTTLICQLLVMTNWSITRIAMDLGFNSVDHIARFFRKEKGITPTAFRRLYNPKEQLTE